jgi:hypothetical protein
VSSSSSTDLWTSAVSEWAALRRKRSHKGRERDLRRWPKWPGQGESSGPRPRRDGPLSRISQEYGDRLATWARVRVNLDRGFRNVASTPGLGVTR